MIPALVGLVAVLAICWTLIYLARLFHPLLDRRIRAAEPTPATKPADPIPSDLVMTAMNWTDPWAREQALKAMSDLYEQTGSWDSVRHVYSQTQLSEQ